MLSHLSFGVADLDRSRRFYDAVLATIGVVCVWESPSGLGYGPAGGNDKLALFPEPASEVPLAAGPGFHLALTAPDREAVHSFHTAAIAHGGTSLGAPGPRPHYGDTYYAAFVSDPDGHKLEIVNQ